MTVDLSAVPGTPAEFVVLLETADAHDMRVNPFPPRSFLWTGPPDGWSWGTETWSMYLRPRLHADGVAWLIEYDDDGGHHVWLEPDHALRVLHGEPLDWKDS